jgi:hypothetical protein
MSQGFDLSSLFNTALQAMTSNRQEINALDGHNGNHGDNMVENLRMITDALQRRGSQPPAEALEHASQVLQSQGRGGTSQYYAKGLSQAANQLKNRSTLDNDDVMTLAQSLLGAIPNEGFPQQHQNGDSVLGQVLGGLIGGQQQAAPQSGGLDVGNVLGALLGGGQQEQAPQQDDGLDLGDVVNALLPAGMAYMQAKQSGAETSAAAGQALMAALTGGQVNPLQARTPRAAAGGLVAQSLLKAITGRR